MKIHAEILLMLLTLGSACAALPAFAEGPQTPSQQVNYGRLFYSDSQRQQLDAERKLPVQPQQTSKKTSAPQKINVAPLTEPVTLQGYVKRSDGKSTLWINRQAVQENSTLNAMQIGKLNRQLETQKGRKTATQTEKLNIHIPANGQHIQLKAGQQFDPKNNQIKEVTTVAKEKQLLLSESADEATEIE